MNEQQFIVWTTTIDFQQWVRQGVRAISIADSWTPVDDVHGLDQASLNIDSPDWSTHTFVALPAKYRRLLGTGNSALALVDDIVAVSMATKDLTDEWRIRLHNLGETWIPFTFLPDVQPSTAAARSSIVPNDPEQTPDNVEPDRSMIGDELTSP